MATTGRVRLFLFAGDTKILTLACKRGIEQDNKELLELTHNPQLNVLRVNVINSQKVDLSLLFHSGLDPETSKIKRF